MGRWVFYWKREWKQRTINGRRRRSYLEACTEDTRATVHGVQCLKQIVVAVRASLGVVGLG